MTFTTNQPRVLLVGAFERDTFGDLLVLLLTERYLEHAAVTAAAPFGNDMTALLGRQIPAHGQLVRRKQFDAIWTVGGHVGAVDVQRAYRQAVAPDVFHAFRDRPRDVRHAELRAFAVGDAPYIAPLTELNEGATRIVNSAGLSGISDIEPSRRARVISLLRAQDAIAVRNQASSRFLERLGIRHRLAPDVVHALGLHVPKPEPEAFAVFQASERVLEQFGIERVARRLATSEQLKDLPLRIVPAGTTPGHDSLTAYEALVAAIRRERPKAQIEIFADRRPLEIAAQIGRATLVISTALHVRIAAAAYGVPRVSLVAPPVTRYAKTWDPAMPHGVSLPNLESAVEYAITAARRPEEQERAASLATQAHENLAALASLATSRTAPARPIHEALASH